MIYLDNNSTTKPLDGCLTFFSNIALAPMNPSSVHSSGRNARKILEDSREKIAAALGLKLGRGARSLIFTSGGTEANNLVLNNFKDGNILYSAIEHASIYDYAKELENAVEIPVDSDGLVDLEFIENFLSSHQGEKNLVTIMYANNETGVIQPVSDIAKITKKFGAKFHTDAVQAFGKIKTNFEEIDFVSISAHKIGGIIGVGALIAPEEFHVKASIIGGGQEKGSRSGTENVIGAAIFAYAAEEAIKNLDEYIEKTKKIRDYLESQVLAFENSVVISSSGNRLPNTSMIAIKNLSSEMQLIEFDLAGIAVSNGSACSSGKVKSSHVLRSMGYGDDVAKSVIRVSLGRDNNAADIDNFLKIWKKLAQNNRGN